MKLPIRRVNTFVTVSSVLLIALILLFSLDLWPSVMRKTLLLSQFTHGIHIASVVFPGRLFAGEQGVAIMPLGDSITYGANSPSHGGYRIWLWQDSMAAGWKIHFVGSVSAGPASLPDKDNEGHPGWRIDQLSTHVVNWLDIYQPQIILLHIGTNDILQGYSVSTAMTRLNTLVNQITTTEPNATLIVAQIIPLGNPALNAKVRQYNNALVTLMQQKKTLGKHIMVVDMYDAVPLSDITDHIHPDNAGYKIMAHVWYTALAQLLTPTAKQPISLLGHLHVS